jgi:oligopeptide transport system substrate-binding protein
MKTRSIYGLLGALVLFFGHGCGNSSGGFSSRTGSTSNKIFRYPSATAPTTLDPAKAQDIETIETLSNAYAPLVDYDENNGLIGALADSWEVIDGGKVYRFKLKDAKFSDGSPLTSDDVKASWERALSKDLGSSTAETYLGDIVGAKELAEGKTTQLTGVKILDSKTFEVSIDAPKPYFLGKLTYLCCRVVKRSQGNKEIASVSESIASGPFKVSEYVTDQLVTLSRNEEYFGEKPILEKIQRKVVKDAATRMNLFKRGEADYITVEKQDWKKTKEDIALRDQLKFIKRPAIYYLLLSGKAYEPFKDRHVRRAVAMAIDRDRIANKILNGVPVAERWLPAGIINLTPSNSALKFDPASAKKELSLSAFSSADKLPELEVMVRSDNSDAKYVAEAIYNDLKNNLGIKVKVKSLEWGAMLKARNRGELPAALLNWFGDYIDPQNFLSLLMTSKASANFDKWSNPDFDALCAKADIEAIPTTRSRLYADAESIMLSEVPRVPLYHGVDGVLISSRVNGIRYSLLGALPHTKVSLK